MCSRKWNVQNFSKDNIIFIFNPQCNLSLYTIFSFKTHLLNSAVFITAVTSSLERLKPSLRTVFPSELVLATTPDSKVDQHLADILSDHKNHQRATHIAEVNPASTPPPSSSSSYGVDYEGGLKDAVKVLISYMYTIIHFAYQFPHITSYHPFHY